MGVRTLVLQVEQVQALLAITGLLLFAWLLNKMFDCICVVPLVNFIQERNGGGLVVLSSFFGFLVELLSVLTP